MPSTHMYAQGSDGMENWKKEGYGVTRPLIQGCFLSLSASHVLCHEQQTNEQNSLLKPLFDNENKHVACISLSQLRGKRKKNALF